MDTSYHNKIILKLYQISARFTVHKLIKFIHRVNNASLLLFVLTTYIKYSLEILRPIRTREVWSRRLASNKHGRKQATGRVTS